MVSPTLIASAAFLDAKDIDYKTKVVDLFARSGSCQIEGSFSWQDVDCEVNYTANSEKQLNEVKQRFLAVNAKFFGLDNFGRQPSMHTSHLSIIWRDNNDKVVGEMSLLDGKMLVFSDKTIYKVDNVTLLFGLVSVTNPAAFAEKKKR